MVRTSRSKSVSESQEKSRLKKTKIQDGGQGHDKSGNYGKQSPMLSPMASSTVRKSRGMHSPLNLSGSRKLPSLPTDINSPRVKDQEKTEEILCALLTCRKEVKESDNAVSCNKCNRWLHQTCAGFNQTEYKALNKKGKNQDNLMWFCDGCVPQIRCFLQGRSQTQIQSPTSSSGTNNDLLCKKIDALVDCVHKMEKAHQRREERFEEIIEEKVSNYLHQQNERSSRQCNLIIHNLPESDSKVKEERVDHDLKEVNSILQHLEVDDAEVAQPVRLGKKPEDSSKPRLLRVTVNSERSRIRALSSAKLLKRSKNQTFTRVYITPDLTYEQRERETGS